MTRSPDKTHAAAERPAPADPHGLPDPRHVERLPAGLPPKAVSRIRHALHQLPQVVRPADFLADPGTDPEAHLDALGLVMLQKALPGQRPSRWIAPQDIEPALAHLHAVGGGAQARPLMLERHAALEAMAVTRRGGDWSRLVRHTLPLSEPDWKLPIFHRVPVPRDAVWAFFRDGDAAALQAAMGPPPRHAQAPQVVARVESLIAEARSRAPQHLASLLPRLQAECASPLPLDELLGACTRAAERWAQQAAELDALDGLAGELAFHGYPATFPKARTLARRVQLYVGPPNSGKTHAAFERLAQALDGAYLAPLRLLALEGRDRLVARGVPCSLLTGEESVPAEGARVVSSTIEMMSTQRELDVAVIDEAQMIFDASRGWAWTQAIVAVPAREVIVICSAFAVRAIERLLGLCGERCEVRHFERKQHVQMLPGPVPLARLALGDAVVAFSRREVLMLRDRIAAAGHPVSVVYGALPPEVRRREADRFAEGASHILVATDAIGMGLNLPIRRVLFSTLVKFDGVADRPLEVSEVHQIAGRAGRYGMHEEGFVGLLEGAEPEATAMLQELLAQQPRAPRDFRAPVAPNPWHVATIAERLARTRLREVLAVFVEQLRLDDAHFAVAPLEQMLDLAGQLDERAPALPLRMRFTYAQAPVDTRTPTLVEAFLDWAESHARTGQAGRPGFLDEVDGASRLERMEQALRACTLWLWLGLRFEGVYGHVDEVLALRSTLNDGIERQLKGKRPLAARRMHRGRAR
ncbi:MAG TPA: helicase-related protein [Rubrivivax sp.]|nr:helicase-related protein [Rubrivivax sp.]